jgi:DNA-binding transcriptional ArsR family regulator
MTITEEQRKLLESKAEILKALAHPVRLCIVRKLVEYGQCNVSKVQCCLSMPQSTISQHLGRLKAAGIVTGIRKGTEIYYEATNEDAIQVTLCLIPQLEQVKND